MKNELIVKGRVESLCINGSAVNAIDFSQYGPVGDHHSGLARTLSGHDGVYRLTSELQKDDLVFNWRSWTGLSREEVNLIERDLGLHVPPGILLENITFVGIPNFSKLIPTTRFVFPRRTRQAILTVWEENAPCDGVGKRMERLHGVPKLSGKFIGKAQDRRGVMGFVLAAGRVEVGDEVLVYPPVE